VSITIHTTAHGPCWVVGKAWCGILEKVYCGVCEIMSVQAYSRIGAKTVFVFEAWMRQKKTNAASKKKNILRLGPPKG